METRLAPGVFVRNPGHPEWGLGQVQSAVGDRVTVNFENAGKLSISANLVTLELADPTGPISVAPGRSPR